MSQMDYPTGKVDMYLGPTESKGLNEPTGLHC